MQEIRGAKKFKHAGIEPSLKFNFDGMYSKIFATRKYVWTLSLRVLGGNDSVDPGTSNVNIVEADLEEESGDSEEDGFSNFRMTFLE